MVKALLSLCPPSPSTLHTNQHTTEQPLPPPPPPPPPHPIPSLLFMHPYSSLTRHILTCSWLSAALSWSVPFPQNCYPTMRFFGSLLLPPPTLFPQYPSTIHQHYLRLRKNHPTPFHPPVTPRLFFSICNCDWSTSYFLPSSHIPLGIARRGSP